MLLEVALERFAAAAAFALRLTSHCVPVGFLLIDEAAFLRQCRATGEAGNQKCPNAGVNFAEKFHFSKHANVMVPQILNSSLIVLDCK